MRKTLKPFTFRKAVDGTVTIPAGVFVFAAVPTMHSDVAMYGEDAHIFNGFRFVPEHILGRRGIRRAQTASTSDCVSFISTPSADATSRLLDCNVDIPDEPVAPRNALVGTSPNFLAWGAGKHQCPGRFFAAVETKMMLAYVVSTFDVATDGHTGKGHGHAMDNNGASAGDTNDHQGAGRGNEGSSRPKDLRLEANCFPNPWAKIRMRRRPVTYYRA